MTVTLEQSPGKCGGKTPALKCFTSTCGRWGKRGRRKENKKTKPIKLTVGTSSALAVVPEDTTTPSNSHFSHFVGEILTQKLSAGSPRWWKQGSYMHSVNLRHKFPYPLLQPGSDEHITSSPKRQIKLSPPSSFLIFLYYQRLQFSSFKGQYTWKN